MSTIAVKNFTSTQSGENMEFSPSGTANMIVTANNITVTSGGQINAVDFNSTSDVRLKQNVQPLTGATEVVNQLQGVSFDWIENGERAYGLIAQEVEKIVPELVEHDEHKDVKYVKYLGLIAYLVEANKELQARVEALESAGD